MLSPLTGARALGPRRIALSMTAHHPGRFRYPIRNATQHRPCILCTPATSLQGIRGFWAGTGPSVIRVGLGAGLHFVLLEQVCVGGGKGGKGAMVSASGCGHGFGCACRARGDTRVGLAPLGSAVWLDGYGARW